MKFIIKHETKGRMRIHAVQNRMSYAQADTLLYFLHSQKEVTFAKVYDRTCDAVISYVGDRQTIIELLRGFHYEDGRSDREFGKGVKQYLPGKINWQDCAPLRKTLDPSLSDPYLSHFTPLRKIYLERTNNTCSRKDRSSGFRCNCHRCFSS